MQTGNRLAPAVLLASLALCGCGGGGSTPETPAVGINTATGWSDSPYISRDGKRLYFMYSRYDFGPWIISGGTTLPQATGPDRPGLHKSAGNPFDESDIYVATRRANGTWSEPVNLGLNGDWGDSSGMEMGDADHFIWLRGDGTTNDIVTAARNPDGTWSTPVALPASINDHTGGAIVDNPHISADGTGLWFTASRSGGQGGKDLWFSMLDVGGWSAPVDMAPPFNSAGDEDQFYFSPTTLDIFWNSSSGLMHCVSNGSTCSATPEQVVIPGCAYAAEASMPDDGQTLYFGCGNLTTGHVQIMFSQRQGDGSWGTATPVD